MFTHCSISHYTTKYPFIAQILSLGIILLLICKSCPPLVVAGATIVLCLGNVEMFILTFYVDKIDSPTEQLDEMESVKVKKKKKKTKRVKNEDLGM